MSAGLTDAIESKLIYSGWPHHGPGWINLDISRFHKRVTRYHLPVVPKAPLDWEGRYPRRIGLVGRFVGLFGFPTNFFQAARGQVDLLVFDIEHMGRCAEYLEAAVSEYHLVALDGGDSLGRRVEQAHAAINGARLDVLINVNWKPDAFDLLDRVTTPCITNYCVGSDLLHHRKVDFHVYGQPQPDYPWTPNRIFSNTTKRPFSDTHVYLVEGYFDPRDLQHEPLPAWEKREPLIVLHGSLDKLEHPEFLDGLLALLEEDSSANCVLMGKDNGRALDLVQRSARARGVAARVHYEGAFIALRGPDGRLNDPGWRKLVSYLQRARLAPDPFPMGGGSSRVESYLMGVPCVHMGVRFDQASWGRRQLAVCEIPSLLVPEGTAYSVAEYRALSQRCLTDGAFAHALIQDQRERARRVTNAEVWWREFLEICASWRDATARSGVGGS